MLQPARNPSVAIVSLRATKRISKRLIFHSSLLRNSYRNFHKDSQPHRISPMRLVVFIWFLMLLEELPSQRKSIQACSRVLFYTFTRKAPARFRRKRLRYMISPSFRMRHSPAAGRPWPRHGQATQRPPSPPGAGVGEDASVSTAEETALSSWEGAACSAVRHPAKHSSSASSASIGLHRKSFIGNTSFPKEKSRGMPCFSPVWFLYTILVFPMLVSISTVAGS